MANTESKARSAAHNRNPVDEACLDLESNLYRKIPLDSSFPPL